MKNSFFIWIVIYPNLGLFHNSFINENAFMVALAVVWGLSWIINKIMHKSILLFGGFLLLLISFVPSGCNSASELQNTLADSIDVYMQLKPNEEWDSGRHTYGKDSIVGNSIKYRLTTDSSDIYVDFNLTILELHPRITANLLSFIHGEMLDWGFINESDTIPPFTTKKMTDKGYSQSDIVKKALDWEGERFYHQLPLIFEYGERGYNLDIETYPVFLNENYVTYKKYAYYYTGGAHGNYSICLHTYNLKTGESVDLEDIVIPKKLNKVRERVAYHMAAEYPIYSSVNSIEAYLDSLNRWKGLTDLSVIFGFKKENEIEQISLKNYPINDPGIHSAGLVFTYEKYHLTPGICGCPTILISFDEIRDCLKEPFCNYHSDLNEFEIYQ